MEALEDAAEESRKEAAAARAAAAEAGAEAAREASAAAAARDEVATLREAMANEAAEVAANPAAHRGAAGFFRAAEKNEKQAGDVVGSMTGGGDDSGSGWDSDSVDEIDLGPRWVATMVWYLCLFSPAFTSVRRLGASIAAVSSRWGAARGPPQMRKMSLFMPCLYTNATAPQ